MTAGMRRFDDACEGLLLAVRMACQPAPHEDARYPLTLSVPYYGKPVDVAVWWALYVMREARRLRLYPSTRELEAECRQAA